jgi:dihydroorotase
MKYDFWIRGGKVVDPTRGIEKVEDILIYNGRILPPPDGPIDAEEVVDARDCLVFPGLIDFHTHVAHNVTDFSLNPDLIMLPNGVTAAVDAGSTGWVNFPAFSRYVASCSEMDIKGFLNVASNGIPEEPYCENTDPSLFNEKSIRYTFDKYSSHLLGLKIRAGKNISHEFGLRPVSAAVKLGEKLGVPVVAHVVYPEEPYTEVLKLMRPGDILCHCFQDKGPYSIVDDKGEVLAAVKEARKNGILFDHAAGRANYGFGVAQSAVRSGFFPDIISTDVVTYSVYKKKVFALPYTLSAFLAMGMPLREVIRCCTQTPARLMKLKDAGSLMPGSIADIAIFKFQEREIQFQDQSGHTVGGKGLLVPQMTIKAGRIAYRNITFMDW